MLLIIKRASVKKEKKKKKKKKKHNHAASIKVFRRAKAVNYANRRKRRINCSSWGAQHFHLINVMDPVTSNNLSFNKLRKLTVRRSWAGPALFFVLFSFFLSRHLCCFSINWRTPASNSSQATRVRLLDSLLFLSLLSVSFRDWC